MFLTKNLQNISKFLPASNLTPEIKFIIKYWTNYGESLLKELTKVPIILSSVENLDGIDTPFVVLKDKTILYGQSPSLLDRKIYNRAKNTLPSTITEKTIRVAIDVIMRYLYPHSMPHLTMPYPRIKRRCFHYQHIETIDDIPGLSTLEKEYLKKLYTPKNGELILDVGAYMGYGTVRLSKEIGTNGHVIAVEADSDALCLLKHNISSNNLSNVTVMPKAIWNQANLVLDLSKSSRQANSLITNIVEPLNSSTVETTTVDEIVQMLDSRRVDFISLTVNGAELEAVKGMKETLTNCSHIRLSIAGWYKRDNKRICEIIYPLLREYGLQVAVGRKGGVLAWK